MAPADREPRHIHDELSIVAAELHLSPLPGNCLSRGGYPVGVAPIRTDRYRGHGRSRYLTKDQPSTHTIECTTKNAKNSKSRRKPKQGNRKAKGRVACLNPKAVKRSPRTTTIQSNQVNRYSRPPNRQASTPCRPPGAPHSADYSAADLRLPRLPRFPTTSRSKGDGPSLSDENRRGTHKRPQTCALDGDGCRPAWMFVRPLI